MPLRLPPASAGAPHASNEARCAALLRLSRMGSRGQSMTEYLVALSVVVAMLVGAAAGDPSVLQLFLDAVRTGWGRLLAAIALPV